MATPKKKKDDRVTVTLTPEIRSILTKAGIAKGFKLNLYCKEVLGEHAKVIREQS
jgi:uncharacterized protein (DUF1778 family)